MKILIAGTGKQAYFLCRDFVSKGHSVVAISDDADDARWLARRLKGTVVYGRGSDPATLEDAGVREADAVVAATGRDMENLVICQLAERRFRVPLTLALVTDPDNRKVFPALGVQNVVSITPLISRAVEQRTVTDEIRDLAVMAEGKVNVTELLLPEDSPVLGKTLAELDLPRESLIASLVRKSAAIIPRGDTALRAGDRVLLVTLPASHGRAVKYLTGEE
jgi:trk system potassium uptake protein TrkA